MGWVGGARTADLAFPLETISLHLTRLRTAIDWLGAGDVVLVVDPPPLRPGISRQDGRGCRGSFADECLAELVLGGTRGAKAVTRRTRTHSRLGKSSRRIRLRRLRPHDLRTSHVPPRKNCSARRLRRRSRRGLRAGLRKAQPERHTAGVGFTDEPVGKADALPRVIRIGPRPHARRR